MKIRLFKIIDFLTNCSDFLLKCSDSVLKMFDFVFKMTIFAALSALRAASQVKYTLLKMMTFYRNTIIIW